MLPWTKIFADQYKRVSSANTLIEDEHGRLLILKAHYKPYWSLPGGLIDEDDTPREAAIREIQEEIGIELGADNLEFAALINRISDITDTYLFVFRTIDPIDSNTKFTLQSDEIAEYDWVSAQQVRDEKHGAYSMAVRNWASEQPETYIEEML